MKYLYIQHNSSLFCDMSYWSLEIIAVVRNSKQFFTKHDLFLVKNTLQFQGGNMQNMRSKYIFICYGN